MSHTLVKTTCKVCAKPIEVKFDALSEPQWKIQLLPLATCNHCFDMVAAFQAAESVIKGICGKMSNKLLLGEIDEKQRSHYREALNVATKKYAVAVMRFHGKETRFWTEDIPEFLLNNPQKWWPIMEAYRKEAATAYGTPSLNPFEKPQKQTGIQALAAQIVEQEEAKQRQQELDRNLPYKDS